MKYCKNCRKQFPNTSNYCISCGKFLQSIEDEATENPGLFFDQEMFDVAHKIVCEDCQAETPDFSRYCPRCGIKFKGGGLKPPHFQTPSRKSILIILGFVTLAAIIWVGVKKIDFSKPINLSQAKVTQTDSQTGFILSTPTTQKQIPTIESVGTEKLDGPEDMVFVPGGSFIMGGSDSDIHWHLDSCNHYANCDIVDFDDLDPKHEVDLDSFYMDTHEVTNAQYRRCVNEGVCKKPDNKAILKYLDGDYFTSSSFDDYPVVAITWNDAAAYCQWDGGKQLPTEAQWEKAAQGPDGWYFPWSPDPNGYSARNVFGGTKPLANFCDANCQMQWKDSELYDGYKFTAPVKSFPPGPYGIYDMAGNVTEWIQDYYKKDYYSNSTETNPLNSNAAEWRVTRGGGWNNGIYYLSSIFRSAQDPNKSTAFLGFRCVKNE